MLRILLSGVCLFTFMPLEKANARAGSADLTADVSVVLNPETGTAQAVSDATKIASVTGGRVIDVFLSVASTQANRGLTTAAGSVAASTTIINNFVSTPTSRALASGGVASGSDTASGSDSTNGGAGTTIGGVGTNTIAQSGGGSAFAASVGSGAANVGSTGADSASVANAAGMQQLQDYAATVATSFEGMKANYEKFVSNVSDNVGSAVDNVAANYFQKGINSGVLENGASANNAPLGSGLLAALTPPARSNENSPLAPIPADRANDFARVFQPTVPPTNLTPTTPPATAVAAVAKPETLKPEAPKPSGTGTAGGGVSQNNNGSRDFGGGGTNANTAKPPESFKVCLMPFNCKELIDAFNKIIKDCRNLSIGVNVYNCGGAPGKKDEILNCGKLLNDSCSKDISVNPNEKGTSITFTFLTDLYKDDLVSWKADLKRAVSSSDPVVTAPHAGSD